MDVGTEWLPSATTDKSMELVVTAVGEDTCSQDCGVSIGGIQIVEGLPSNAAAARAVLSPGRRAEEVAVTPPLRPTLLSSNSSEAAAESRAVPDSEKVRAVGSLTARAMYVSVSDLKGSAGLARSRVS